jgi:transcriptional regulator with XRE-family HTH domain
MNSQRFGRSVRALRQRLGWRQADLAARCGLSQPTISRVERGVVAGTPLGAVERIVLELGGELDMRVRWRGEELDRLDAMHASIVERLVEILTSLGWECAVEVTFWIRREQGSADVLAWHPPTGRLLVVETKSVVPDLQTMLSSLDRKVRLGPAIAAQRGWRVTGVGRTIVFAGTAANRARAERFGATLRAVLPQDGRSMRRWLENPVGPCPAALWFFADMQVKTAIKRRRVRAKRRSGSQVSAHARSSEETTPFGHRGRPDGLPSPAKLDSRSPREWAESRDTPGAGSWPIRGPPPRRPRPAVAGTWPPRPGGQAAAKPLVCRGLP